LAGTIPAAPLGWPGLDGPLVLGNLLSLRRRRGQRPRGQCRLCADRAPAGRSPGLARAVPCPPHLRGSSFPPLPRPVSPSVLFPLLVVQVSSVEQSSARGCCSHLSRRPAAPRPIPPGSDPGLLRQPGSPIQGRTRPLASGFSVGAPRFALAAAVPVSMNVAPPPRTRSVHQEPGAGGPLNGGAPGVFGRSRCFAAHDQALSGRFLLVTT